MKQKLGTHIMDILGGLRLPSSALAVLVLLGLNSTSYAGVIALNSSLDVVATSGRSTFEVVDTASASQGGTTNTLGWINANAVSTSAGGTSQTSGSAIATWDNTAQGQVRFENLGWDNSAFSSGVVSNSGLGGTQWTYTFIADVTGQFYLDWDVSLDQILEESFGLIDIRFSIAGTAGSQTVMGVNSTGSTTRNIYAGNEYTAKIQTNAGIFGGVGGRTSFMDGVFNWSMDSGPPASAPEPTSFALLGLGLIALRLNRRKKLA